MLPTLVDHSIAILCGLLVLVLLLGSRYRATADRRFLAAGTAALGVMLLIAGLGFVVRTPTAEISTLLDQLAAAGEKRDAEAIIVIISNRYDYAGYNRDKLAGLVREELKAVAIGSLSLNGREISASRDEAIAKFVAVANGSYRGTAVQRYPVRLTLTFSRESDGWKIVKIQRFEPVVNQDHEIPLNHH